MGIIGTLQLKNATAEKDEQYTRSYSRTYLAYFDVGSNEQYVRDHCGIGVKSLHPTDTFAVVKRLSVSLAADEQITYFDETNPSSGDNNTLCYLWQIEVEYGLWNPLDHSPDGNPLN